MSSSTLSHTHTEAHAHKEHRHSPFYWAWELLALGCVMFLTLSFAYTQFVHVDEVTLHLIELVDFAAEIILIAEVILIFLVTKNKIRFLQTKWMTILAVLPFGSAFRLIRVAKLGWHTAEKTRAVQFLKHPIKGAQKWVHVKLKLHTKG